LADALADQPGPVREEVEQLLGSGDGASGAPPGDGDDDLASRLGQAFGREMLLAALASLGITALGIGGLAMVTRYISPKEALRNPQRAMLYGFIKATPGAHLKQLSDEFKMKTSSILWHIRKLESADLVRSERANGFRVFYPVQGGIEVKRLSRAITALQNGNARAVQGLIERRPGLALKDVSERLHLQSGTVRWHVRKLRDFGLVDELVREDGSLFYGTPLGKKALETVEGSPTVATARPNAVAQAE
jgi:DNA-binding MarR family transcriptional regulator